ncbi:MAG: 3'-5' exoribonuclease [Melioribacteraceae bacterium]|nr:3'-5' exoribonuclease [Melioribacteraceae bacterium]
MKHVMIDLETMGKNNNAPIVAIGAVEFNKDGIVYNDNRRSSFYCSVDLNSSVDEGGIMDASTVIWWMEQSEDAKSVFKEQIKYNIKFALIEFSRWIGCEDLCVWGNGATFDLVILESAYERSGIKIPWNYRRERCYKTMREMFSDIPFASYGVKHNALDDSIGQALHLVKICNNKGITL